jgi:hypothetical protein
VQRRAYERRRIWLALRLEGPDHQPALAVSRDASKAGLLVLSARSYEVGTSVRAIVRIPPEGDMEGTTGHRPKDDGRSIPSAEVPKASSAKKLGERTLHATVVRCEPNDDDPEGAWPSRIALRFDEPDDELEAWLRDLEPPPTYR